MKHWSRTMYYLCYRDKSGRMRVTWDTDKGRLALYGLALDWPDADPVMYAGFGAKLDMEKQVNHPKPKNKKGHPWRKEIDAENSA